jgi:hypothetical protein
MKWLYILFTLNISNFPINVLEIPFSISSSSGNDERFPMISNDEEVFERIRLQLYYLEQIRELENTKTLEYITPIIRDILPLYEISPIRMNAGGLMDDWERNI